MIQKTLSFFWFILIVVKYPFITVHLLDDLRSVLIVSLTAIIYILNRNGHIRKSILYFVLAIFLIQCIQYLNDVSFHIYQLQFLFSGIILILLGRDFRIIASNLKLWLYVLTLFSAFGSIVIYLILTFSLPALSFSIDDFTFYFPFGFVPNGSESGARMYGIFAEPAVFAFSCFTLLIWCPFNSKILKNVSTIVFLVAGLLTFSVSGILAAVFSYFIARRSYYVLIFLPIILLILFQGVLNNFEANSHSGSMIQSIFNRYYIFTDVFTSENVSLFGKGIRDNSIYEKEIVWDDVLPISRISRGGAVTGMLAYIFDFGIFSIFFYVVFIKLIMKIIRQSASFSSNYLTIYIAIFSLSTDMLFTSVLVNFILIHLLNYNSYHE
jgi:hypothetical protein